MTEPRASATFLFGPTETEAATAFAARVGHDLKNPLNSIVMTCRILQATSSEPATLRHVERICARSLQLARMVDDLFDCALAGTSASITPNVEPGDAIAIANKVVSEQELVCPERAIRLEASGDTSGDWDVARLEQVMSTLVANAQQHGAGSAPVEVSLRGDEAELVLTVRNAGAVAEPALEEIFEPFHASREAAARRVKHRGLGVGLYLAREIVRAHGGTIDVHSSEVEGTTFHVRVPKHAPSAHAAR